MEGLECGGGVLISDNMKVTITPEGKHESLSWMAGCAVRMGNMIYKAYVLNLKWRMCWWCYSYTCILRSVAFSCILALINTPGTSNSKWRHMCVEELDMLYDIYPISNDL